MPKEQEDQKLKTPLSQSELKDGLYRELKQGEQIEEGDESYNHVAEKWQRVEKEHVGCGEPFDPKTFLKMRRKV
jgi:hypothetical protein